MTSKVARAFKKGVARAFQAGGTLAVVMCVAGLAVVAGRAQVKSAEKPRVSAGNGTLIIGSYPKQYWIIDEATEKIVGTIPFQSGIPRRTTI
jgi:hypothetical protein